MFRSDKPTNYENVYNGLVVKLAQADYQHAMEHLGAREAGDEVAMEVFGRTCLIGPRGVRAKDGEPLDFTVRIVVAHYLLQTGRGDLTGQWRSYRDFKDGAFFHGAFSQTSEHRIARKFSGRMAELESAAKAISGETLDADLGGDFCSCFPALPRIPLALIFYDADEEFSASARILFDDSAPLFLDMECLAVMGLILANQLASVLK
ncbi:MAG: DUF3786 domain-containing protein [Deltaproteobacteria bacterium]|nr:DUF3786 domain-containing protein [Deltaproteobacteria bacterium]MBW2053844.1 DUF3786 domain-containing protein [Deltaproteobacteria bacterium]MBW2142527.1 DUF3786 domain-containing protein [Deltaproteobacteria bacterium]MBW2324597.1 DUF3786 domain-containing protein [Deltaproteobacteria bacterium]